MKTWILATALAIAGHASPAVATAGILGDDAPPDPAQIMAMPPDLRQAFHRAVNDRSVSSTTRLELLMAFVFDKTDGLGIEYDHAATHTVEQTFRTRKANCLAFTMLTLVLAREAGLEAKAQRIDEVLSWRQENGHIVRSNHVNTGVRAQQRHYTIDVASDDILARNPPRRIADRDLIAMYYSNRAMELVIDGRPDDAMPFMAMSLQLDSDSADNLSNAGVVALRIGDMVVAERYYRAALEQNARHGGALSNLSLLYERMGDPLRARQLRLRNESVLKRDPFHQFLQGHAAEAAGNYAAAVAHYRRAIRLHPGEHRFHFALARAYLYGGDAEQAGKALLQARKLADHDGSARYQAKLDLLKARGGD